MASSPQDLLYDKSHEWVRIDGDQVIIGITQFAANQLGDVVFVELPEVGRKLDHSDSFGTVESVKAVSEVFTPLSGEVIEVNQELLDDPENINTDPYGDGWMIKLRAGNLSGEKGDLLDAAAYDAFVTDEADK